jgi:ribosomal protein S19
MSRSLKKGPYINFKLEKKVLGLNESGKKSVVKTWARASMISPDFVGHTVAVHNGNKVYPRICHREHGRTQAGRIRAYPHFPRSWRKQEKVSPALLIR